MNCDWVQENIPLYLYNELADDARHGLGIEKSALQKSWLAQDP